MTAILRRLGFGLGLAALMIAGTVLRLLAPGSAGLAANGQGSTSQAVGQPSAPEKVVLDVYHALDEGRFGEAFEQVFDIHWDWSGGQAPQATGLTERERFIAEVQKEYGSRGELVTLIEINATEDKKASPNYASPELQALRSIKGVPAITRVAWVKVQGTVKIACGLRSWERYIAVVQTAGTWKVLLPPPDPLERSRISGLFPEKGGAVPCEE